MWHRLHNIQQRSALLTGVTTTSPTRRGAAARCSAGTQQVVVVGGGAAGLTAAYFAALHGADVTVLERTAECGKKILMSGGARCNVMPAAVDLQQDFFSDAPPGVLRAMFASWDIWGCWSWLCDPDHVGLQLELEDTSSKWFPASNSAKEVRDKLTAACRKRGVQMRYSASVKSLQAQAAQGNSSACAGWQVELDTGERVQASKVVLASGGLSYPKVGTDGTGHHIAGQLGHTYDVYPALTPLRGKHPGSDVIAGVSLDVEAHMRYDMQATGHNAKRRLSSKTGKAPVRKIDALRSGFLFTHKGYSGPAVLDLSHHAVRKLDSGTPEQFRLHVAWSRIDRSEWFKLLTDPANSSQRIAKVIQRGLGSLPHEKGLPERLIHALCAEIDIWAGVQCGSLPKRHRERLLDALVHFELPITGHLGYKMAEVTGGGVRLTEMDTRTLESKLAGAAGLHFCGEICDVFGRIGGFNFYWAWVSGRMAGLGASGTSWLALRDHDTLSAV